MPPEKVNLGGSRPPRGERQPRSTPRAQSDDKPKTRTPADRKLAASVASGYQFIGATTIGIATRLGDNGLANTGVATINNAEAIAEAWLDLAEKNPKVKAYLQKITEVSAVGVLVSLHLATALPLLIDRGIIPETAAMFMSAAADQTPEPSVNGNGDGGDG